MTEYSPAQTGEVLVRATVFTSCCSDNFFAVYNNTDYIVWELLFFNVRMQQFFPILFPVTRGTQNTILRLRCGRLVLEIMKRNILFFWTVDLLAIFLRALFGCLPESTFSGIETVVFFPSRPVFFTCKETGFNRRISLVFLSLR